MHDIHGDDCCIVSNVLAVKKEVGLAKSLSDVILVLELPKPQKCPFLHYFSSPLFEH
jgi:hypothetical protein